MTARLLSWLISVRVTVMRLLRLASRARNSAAATRNASIYFSCISSVGDLEGFQAVVCRRLAGGFNHRAELASGFYRAHVFFVALQAHHRPASDLDIAAHDAHLGPLCQLALLDAAAEHHAPLLRTEDFEHPRATGQRVGRLAWTAFSERFAEPLGEFVNDIKDGYLDAEPLRHVARLALDFDVKAQNNAGRFPAAHQFDVVFRNGADGARDNAHLEPRVLRKFIELVHHRLAGPRNVGFDADGEHQFCNFFRGFGRSGRVCRKVWPALPGSYSGPGQEIRGLFGGALLRSFAFRLFFRINS